jgi:transposase
MYTKAPVVGILERKGNLRLVATNYTDALTLHKLITENIEHGTAVISDNYKPYRTINKLGYESQRVGHGQNEYVRGNISTNALEGSWAYFKLSLQAIYVGVAGSTYRNTCAEFAFRYNRREQADGERFNEWFQYSTGHLTYKNLITGPSKPQFKRTMSPGEFRMIDGD